MTYRTLPNDKTELYRANWAPEKSEPEIEPGEVYGAIQCVPITDIPKRARSKHRIQRGFWLIFMEEILLRLEQTPRKEALRIPFANEVIARRAVQSIWNIADRTVGEGLIETYRRGKVLYIRRGKNWNEKSDSALAALSK